MGTSNTCARVSFPSESIAMMCRCKGGPAGSGSISCSKRSILLRILMLTHFVLQDAEFCMPVRKRKAQPLQIGIACEDLRLDSRDLASASIHSRRCSHAFQRDFIERAALAVEYRLLACVLLVPANNAVSVFRIDLHQSRVTPPAFAAY